MSVVSGMASVISDYGNSEDHVIEGDVMGLGKIPHHLGFERHEAVSEGMDGRRRTTAEDRLFAIRLVAEGYSFAAAGREVGCNYRTVQRWWIRDHQDGNIRNRPAGAPPRATDADQERAIVELARRERFITAGQIKEALGLECSLSTIYRYV